MAKFLALEIETCYDCPNSDYCDEKFICILLASESDDENAGELKNYPEIPEECPLDDAPEVED